MLAWLGAVLGEQIWLAWVMGFAPTEELAQAFFLGLAPLPLAALGVSALVESVHAFRTQGPRVERSPLEVTGRALGALVAIGLFLLVSYLVDLRIVLGLSRPSFVAAGLALANLVVGVLAYQPARGLGLIFTSGLRRVADGPAAPLLAPIVPVWRLWLGLMGIALVLGAWGVHRQREVVEAVNWPQGVAMLVGLGVFVAAGSLLRRHRRARLIPAGVAVALSLLLMLAPGVSRALWLVGPPREVSFAAIAGLDLLRATLDFDHDGRLAFAGDGDCAAFDARRHPMALDIPGDGIDQDCDGRDALPGQVDFADFHTTLLPRGFQRRPPLVLLLTIDAFNPRRLRHFGASRDPMPQLEHYFDESVLFRSAFAQGPSTRLSFPALFTSRWDSELPRTLEGRHPYPLEDSAETLAERLSEAGFRTAAVLPDALFQQPRWHGLLQGFQESELAAPLAGSHHGATQVTDAALRELRRDDPRPLFLWVHYFDAHPPHQHPRGEPEYGDEPVDRYDAELHHVDTGAARLLAEVEQRYGEDAWVVITGDHACAFDAPRHTRHGYGYDLYASVLHVPLVMHVPGVEAGELSQPVSLLDVTPTLVDLLGLAPEEHDDFRGRSLVPALIRRPAGSPPHVYSQYFLEERLWTDEDPLVMASVVTDDRQLILDRRSGRYELYDWRHDPLERHDLTAQETDTTRELSDELATFVRAVHSAPEAALEDEAGAGYQDAGAPSAADAGTAQTQASPGAHAPGAPAGRAPALTSPSAPRPSGPVPPAAMPGRVH